MKTVFDTSRILTQGCVERKILNHYKDDCIEVEVVGGYKKYLRASEYEFQLPSALRRFNAEREKKTRLLKKQIEKLEIAECKVTRIGEKHETSD